MSTNPIIAKMRAAEEAQAPPSEIVVTINSGTYYADNRTSIVTDAAWKSLIESIQWTVTQDPSGITYFTAPDGRLLEQILLNVPATTVVIHNNGAHNDFQSGNLSVVAS
jgi:hypothetical protein